MRKSPPYSTGPQKDTLSNAPQVEELLKNLEFHKSIQGVNNRINSAESIKEIIVDIKEDIRNLFNINTLTIYAFDKIKKEIYTLNPEGDAIKEIRLPVNNSTIAGYAAYNKKTILLHDVYDERELKRFSDQLKFDRSMDRQLGVLTGQVLAIPIMYERNIMGVMEVMTQKGEDKIEDYRQIFLDEICGVLGIAFNNQEKLHKQKRLSKYDYLIRQGCATQAQIDKATEEARERKELLENLLMQKYNISKEDIGTSLAEYYSCEYVTYNDKIPIPGDLLKNLKKPFLRREIWVPLERVDGKIRVLVDDPTNIIKRDSIEGLLKTKAVKYDISFPDDIFKYIERFFSAPQDSASIDDILGKLEADDEIYEEEDGEVITESHSVIMQLVNKLINEAYARRASDIHIEPNTDTKNVDVRYRVDGECFLYQTLPYSYRAAVVSRIKIMSNLDITVKRLPQDGKIKFRRGGEDEIELRVATIPTQGGVEDIVLRILAKGQTLPLDAVALSSRNYAELIKIMEQPYGMILCVGPTGSGKTTTLHAGLKHINTPGRKIWTAEDPVEITQHGLRQVQVQPKIGFDFAAAMRSFLRADPDVIMVGEMRDFETAKIGVEASLTGHLVLSTLHTNSAPETIVRLLDMGIDPLNFADALLGILAQRLVRTLCKKCKEEYHPSKEEYDEMAEIYGQKYFDKLNVPYTSDFKLYRPKGCPSCGDTGYLGRMGIHELLIASDNIKRMIQRHEHAEPIRETAIEEGMTTLLQDGIQKVLEGYTDLKQVRRVCIK
ncbi:MAG: Flp pilus assembly complex ATPase component TadA [Syntrophaceae bacterium]|nr:Flp pilus assembly complex ATPase component TadA [Syntrophaceae bacterium]